MEKEIKIGDVVMWLCTPYGSKSFIAKGVVRELGVSSFGGIRNNLTSVKIAPIGEYRKMFPNRKTTTISLNKILTPTNNK